MASRFRSKPPAWFWIVTILLLLWECAGVWSWWEHWRHGPAAMRATPTEYDIRYFAALPRWYVWLFALAVWSGLAGGLALLRRQAAARTLYVVSLIATVAMFAYTFTMTDLIAAKGGWVVYFPAVIVALGVVSIWFAGHATRRRWLR